MKNLSALPTRVQEKISEAMFSTFLIMGFATSYTLHTSGKAVAIHNYLIDLLFVLIPTIAFPIVVGACMWISFVVRQRLMHHG